MHFKRSFDRFLLDLSFGCTTFAFNATNTNGDLAVLHYIAFSNFCSFREQSTIDLRVTEGAPATDEFVTGSTGTRVAKAMALIGANASGKSNSLRSLAFLQYFLVKSFQHLDPEAQIPIDQFLFQENKELPTTVEFELDVDGIDYRYSCQLSPEAVLYEQLDVRGNSTRYRNLFRRTGMDVEVARAGIGVSSRSLVKMLRPNSSIISLLHQLDNESVVPMTAWWQSVVTNLTRGMSRRLRSPGWSPIDAANTFEATDSLFQQATEFIHGSDLGISRIELRKEKFINTESGEEMEMAVPYSVHQVEGTDYEIELMLESDGTEALFVLLSKLLPVLHGGTCAVINDLDADLHPDVLPSILHLFLDEETNPKNAQLIFTTHAHEFVFSRLDKRAINIVEKVDGLSSVTRLDSLDGVRNDVDLLKKYRAGQFGGIPNI